MSDLRIAVVLGSTRPARLGGQVAEWVLEQSRGRAGVTYELVDLRDHVLPMFDAPVSPAYLAPSDPAVQAWAAKVAEFDGFVFVTPEYNHSFSAVLKNALDSIYGEFNNKAAAFASYGSYAGARAVEQLRLVASELQLAHVRHQLGFSIFTDFQGFGTPDVLFTPDERHVAQAGLVFDQLESWTGAMRSLRESVAVGA